MPDNNSNLAAPVWGGFIFLPVGGYEQKFDFNDIEYIRAENSYVSIFLVSGKKIMAGIKLKELEALLLGSLIVRCGRSYMVNIHHVLKYVAGKRDGYVVMPGTTITVTDTYCDYFYKCLHRQPAQSPTFLQEQE